MFFRRADFLAVGGCDPTLLVMEEADLCIRFHRLGRTSLVNRVRSLKAGTRGFTSRAAFTMQAGRGHRERIAKVKEVYDEMMRIAEAIHDRGGGR